MDEVWKDVVGSQFYQVSDLGRVRVKERVVIKTHPKYGAKHRSVKPLKILSPADNGKGYRNVALYENGVKRMYVHRLVYEAFVGPLVKGYDINHIDGDRSNNSVVNLEQITHLANIQHKKTTDTHLLGSKTGMAKLTENQIHEIRAVYKARDPEFGCITLARKYGVSHATISRIMSKTCWGHVV